MSAPLYDLRLGDALAAVCLADPPWQYRIQGVEGDVAQQYSTMSFSALAALPVEEWTAPNSILVLWATWPKLDEAMDLLREWAFEFVTGFPWIKTVGPTIRVGIGFWTQSASELVLIGRRGSPYRDGKSARVLGLLHEECRQFYAPGGAPGTHSRKPFGVHEWLEATFDGPYLELFARRRRPGWITWGSDLGFELTPEGVRACEPVRVIQPELFPLGI
jgi:N6-adenosine-specific RNA methylase IME4